jgi:hypothetical protein
MYRNKAHPCARPHTVSQCCSSQTICPCWRIFSILQKIICQRIFPNPACLIPFCSRVGASSYSRHITMHAGVSSFFPWPQLLKRVSCGKMHPSNRPEILGIRESDRKKEIVENMPHMLRTTHSHPNR